MSKTLGFFIVQFSVLMIVYPLWVGKTYKLRFGRWVLAALVSSASTLLIFALMCYAGMCIGG